MNSPHSKGGQAEHNPPHIHVKYGSIDFRINLESLKPMDSLSDHSSKKLYKSVRAWAEHYSE